MKKILRILFKLLLIISTIILVILIISNLITIIRILLIGITVGNNQYPDSIWYSQKILKGFNGIKIYYSTLKDIYLLFEIPIAIICIIYQIIYNKIIKKRV